MKIALVARDAATLASIEDSFPPSDFERSAQPEIVVVVGGDGTLLRAEREYPGVPKALVKASRVGNLYTEHSAEQVAAALREGTYEVREELALEAEVHGELYRAANDVIIRNKLLTQAIRFTVDAPNHFFDGDFIGDGLVIATPLGSAAYFHTITRTKFTEGIGIAFNNVMQLHDVVPLLSDDALVTITITRGPAELGVDNSMHTRELHEGDTIVVKKSSRSVRLVRIL